MSGHPGEPLSPSKAVSEMVHFWPSSIDENSAAFTAIVAQREPMSYNGTTALAIAQPAHLSLAHTRHLTPDSKHPSAQRNGGSKIENLKI